MNVYKNIIISFLICFVTVAHLQAQNGILPKSKIDPKILQKWKDGEQNIFIVFDSKADLSNAKKMKGKENKTTFVYEQLLKNSVSSQEKIVAFLKEKEIDFRPYYIVNGMALKADSALILSLAHFPEIKKIMEDGLFVAPEVKESKQGERTTGWGITRIKAPQVWAQGFRGQGVTIGGQDTGYDWTHQQLQSKYKGWNGSTANHNYNWHDAIHENNPMTSPGNPCGFSLSVPCDDNNHGTHTMGTMVGHFTTDTIGVAPQSKWIGCRNMEEGYGMLSTYVECFEWFLAPYAYGDGPEDGDPSKMPHVINNSWGCPTMEGCNALNIDVMEEALMNLRSAGCVIVVSNGNSGGTCSTTFDPPAFFEGSFSVGASDMANAIAPFSSKGPVTFDSSNRLKPNVVAPGVTIRSSIRNNGYASYQGTSMAGPHVAGAVALIISANPDLAGEVDKIEDILEQTAIPLYGGGNCGGIEPTETPNNTFGFGLIDVEKAVARARDSLYVPIVKVDGFGYRSNASKIAVLSNPINGYNANDSYAPGTAIHLKSASTHQSVYNAAPQIWNSGATHSQSGDKVWYFDFSAYTTPGHYYVADGINHSEIFEISDSMYNQVFKTALKTFYYQRCGAAKEACCSHAGFMDNDCHLQDTVCKFYGNPALQSRWKNLSGGWHDAGDYNKYVNFAYAAVLDLLFVHHFHPEACVADIGIPESGNGIPDILDEIKYELDWLLKMQDTDGGVHSIVGVANYATASPPSADMADRLYGSKTTAASFSASAMLAFGAREFQKIEDPVAQAYSALLSNAAINAYNWAVSNPGVTFNNAGVIGAGEQQIDAYETNMRRLCSAIYLYACTGNNTYKTYVEANYGQSHFKQWNFVYPFENPTQLSLLYFAGLHGVTPSVANDIKAVFKNSIENSSDNLPAHASNLDAYKAYLTDGNHTWGSNRNKLNMSNNFMAYKEYRLGPANDVVVENITSHYIHYMHGRNPIGMCFLSNMSEYGATNSANTVYHAWFENGSSLWDDVRKSVYGPAPGFLTGGPNPSFTLDACCNNNSCGSSNSFCISLQPPSGQPILKSYLDWNTGWPQNSWQITEPAIYYQSSYLLALADKVNFENNYTPSVEKIVVAGGEIYFENQNSGIIFRTDSGSYFKLQIDNSGVISAIGTTPVFAGSSTVEMGNMCVIDNQKGIIMRSPNLQLWRLSVGGQGILQTESLSGLPSNHTKITNGDLIINENGQGILLSDFEGTCYQVFVTNTGKLSARIVDCN